MPLDDDKRQFEERWQESVRGAAEIARWKPDILGPAIKDYRETPSEPEITAMLGYLQGTLLVEAKNYGLSEADFWADVKKYAAKEAKYAVTNDQTELLKQAEAEAETRRPAGARAEQNKIHKIFRNCLRRIGWLPLGTRGEFKEQDVKQLGKEMSANDLTDLVRDIQQRNIDLSDVDTELARLADEISTLEADIPMAPNAAEEQRIRDEIQVFRNDVATQTQERMDHLQILEKQESKYNLLMTLIGAELETEGKEMEARWGQKVDNLTNQSQKLVTTLDNASRGNDITYQTKLRTEIRNLDIELRKVMQEIVQYKAERPIFLFERFVGVGSIPLLNRLGQASSIMGGAELPDVDRPGPKIPYKT
ncbi:hypothetical protein ACFL3T_05030 [Patescibacteria group bacterium]